jgi:UDP-N-acetylglucosamine diphosphorylase / glucose-1-phosphate thymidylyltransferase / UDP-N-acetylgalactosamine diphosphorylase / glucosamine-1-phosphate N-acetyltransferase / galactosamine-1-phosphate N-acetyltransferase
LSTFDDSDLLVFESNLAENFYPLTLTRPFFSFLLGGMSILERIQTAIGRPVTDITVPKYLEGFCQEKYPKIRVNQPVSAQCLAISSHISPTLDTMTLLRKVRDEKKSNFIAVEESGLPLFAFGDEFKPEFLASSRSQDRFKVVQILADSPKPAIMKFPWELVSENSEAIKLDYSNPNNEKKFPELDSKSSSNFPQKPEVLGDRLLISPNASLESFVSIDTRKGPVIIEDGATIHSFSRISGPAYIGKDSVVKSARIREGTSVGLNCRVGGEIDASIINDFSNKQHDGYIGHSIIGSWVNIGANATNSDLKNTYGPISATIRGAKVQSNSIKVGCYLADMSKTSIGALIFSGKKIGVCSNVFGEVVDDIPSFSFFSQNLETRFTEIYLESAIETQKRMMERRGMKITQAFIDMMKSVYSMTSKDRLSKDVKQEKFDISRHR